MGLFFFIGAVSTYNVTTPAVEYLTKAPVLVDVDSIGLRYDSLLASEIAIISKEIDTHKESARAIHKASSWEGKLDMNSQTKYENALSSKNAATAKRTDLILARNNEKKVAIELAQAKNEKILQGHKDWCSSIGFYLGWLFIAIEFLLYPSKWFCKNYEKMEVIEADAKVQAKTPLTQNVQSTTQSNTTSTPSKVQGKGRARNTANATPLTTTTPQRSMQFPNPAVTSTLPQEGDIIEPQGKGVKRILVEVKGKGLVPKTEGELGTLISAQGKNMTPRKEHLINLLKRFEQ